MVSREVEAVATLQALPGYRLGLLGSKKEKD